MSEPRFRPSELFALFAKLREAELSDADRERLYELLRTDAEARRYYVEYVNLIAGIHWDRSADDRLAITAADTIAADLPTPSPQPRTPVLGSLGSAVSLHRRSAIFSTLAIATLVYGTFSLIVWQMSVRPRPSAGDFAQEDRGIISNDKPIAEIDAVYAAPGSSSEPSTSVRLGQSFRPGDVLNLDSGIVELTFADGARVVQQAPSQLRFESGGSGYLQQGRITARVPQRAVGFTVETPTAIVIDRGTEFGVDVTASGESTVHVFEGRVDLATQESSERGDRAVHLTAGQSRSTKNRDGVLTLAQESIDPNLFVRAKNLPTSASSLPERMRPRQRLLADPSLLVHYTFAGPDESASRLINHAPGFAGKYDGEIHGAAWAEGSRPKRAALQFANAGDRVQASVDGEFTTLSILMSIYLDRQQTKPSYYPLVMCDGWGRLGQFHWQLHGSTHPNVSFCGRDNSVHGVTCPAALNPGDFGRWLKMAVVLNTQSHEATFFLDGAVIGSGTLPPVDMIVLGPICIGHWLPWPKDPQRDLQGRIDELLIFGRALWQNELDAMFGGSSDASTPDKSSSER